MAEKITNLKLDGFSLDRRRLRYVADANRQGRLQCREQLSQFVYALRFVLYDQEPLKEKRERKQSESQRLCASTIRHSKGSKKG